MPEAPAAAFLACVLAAFPTPPIPPPSTLSEPETGDEPVAIPEPIGATVPPPDGAGAFAVSRAGVVGAV